MSVFIIAAAVVWLAILIGVIGLCRTAAAGDRSRTGCEPDALDLPDPAPSSESTSPQHPASRNPG